MIDIRNQDCIEFLKSIDDNSVDCIVTSPPYNKSFFSKQKKTNQIWGGFQINYNGYSDDMPLEDYENWISSVINLCLDKIKPNGSIFINHKPIRHDNQVYNPITLILGSRAKLYQEIIWNRRNSPNIRKDILLPCTERVFWLCKGKPNVHRDRLPKKFISEVWDIGAKPMAEHPAPFPERLVENCVLLTCDSGALVVDPFCGSGTAAVVAKRMGMNFMGSDIDKKYCEYSMHRVMGVQN